MEPRYYSIVNTTPLKKKKMGGSAIKCSGSLKKNREQEEVVNG